MTIILNCLTFDCDLNMLNEWVILMTKKTKKQTKNNIYSVKVYLIFITFEAIHFYMQTK